MGFDIKGLLVILAIVIMIFGTKRLRHMGGDIGSAIKGFRSAMSKDDDDKTKSEKPDDDPQVLEHNEAQGQPDSETKQPASESGHRN